MMKLGKANLSKTIFRQGGSIMKKQLLLFAILVVSLTCFACSQTHTPTVTPSTEQSVEQSVAPTLVPSEELTPSVAPTWRPYSEVFFSRPKDTNLEFWITESVKGKSFSNYETTREYEFAIAWYCGKGYLRHYWIPRPFR